jgi:hypothetical protein
MMDMQKTDMCWCDHKAQWHTQLDYILWYCKLCDRYKRKGRTIGGRFYTPESYSSLFTDTVHELQPTVPEWMMREAAESFDLAFRRATNPPWLEGE